MSFLIKGMKMPKDCENCPMLDDNGDYPTCILTWTSQGYNWSPIGHRMRDCPIVEVPIPHGRLIDADAFAKDECNSCDGACESLPCDCLNCEADCRCDFMKDIADAPTIIPAEEGE